MKTLVKEKSTQIYFILTFIISWSGIIIMSVFTGMPTTSIQFAETGPIALIPFLLGPTIVSLIMTGYLYGKSGFNQLKQKYTKWRINIKWYLYALIMLPFILLIILFILSHISSDYIPKIMIEKNKTSFIITGILTGLIGGGLLEELGWTGFVTPELRKKHNTFKTGLIIGILWGLWHFLPVYWGSGDINGIIDWGLFLPGLFSHYAVLIPYRLLIVWLYENTKSLILVMLMHANLTTFLLFILNISAGGFPLFIYYLVLAIVLWIIVVMIFSKKKLNIV